jgi:hypothetical protein
MVKSENFPANLRRLLSMLGDGGKKSKKGGNCERKEKKISPQGKTKNVISKFIKFSSSFLLPPYILEIEFNFKLFVFVVFFLMEIAF